MLLTLRKGLKPDLMNPIDVIVNAKIATRRKCAFLVKAQWIITQVLFILFLTRRDQERNKTVDGRETQATFIVTFLF